MAHRPQLSSNARPATYTVDAQDETGFTVNLDPAGVAGADFLLRKGKIGGRASAKAFGFTTLVNSSTVADFHVMPVGTIEAFDQF